MKTLNKFTFMKRFFLWALLCLQATVMSADVVIGRVVDAESGEPLEGATLGIVMNIIGQYGVRWQSWTNSEGEFEFTVNSMSKINLKVDYFGYKSLRKNFNCAGGKKDTLNLGDLKLKMASELLKEVTVTAKVKKFYMKGDTIVFNPEAFNLEDGDRISALLRKLPGVSIKDGKLFFMGNEVHLKINGRNTADDFLTGLLPVEAVQNIKAYKKKSELAEVSGMNDGQEQQVLDIIIKPGFMDKWYGQTLLGAYDSEHYRAEANLHYLSDDDPINVYVRASDCESKAIDGRDNNSNALPQRQQTGKLAYSHQWKPEFSGSYEHWNVAISPEHNDTHQNSWLNSETYLSDQLSSFSNSHYYNYNHKLELPLNFYTFLHFNPKTWMYATMTGSFNRTAGRTTGEQKTYRGDTFSEEPQEVVNASNGEALGKTDQGTINSTILLNHVFKNGDLSTTLTVNYRNGKTKSDSHTEYDYRELGTKETLVQTNQKNSNMFQTIFDTKVSYQVVPKKLKVGVAYWMDFVRNNDDNNLLRNGEYDFTNSYDQRSGYFVNEPRIELEADLGDLYMHARLKVQNVEELFDYQRGKLDTITHRNTWFPRPFFEFKWKMTKKTELKGSTNWEYHVTNLLDCMNYVDDTNPLNIVMGNPKLKASSDLYANLNYSMMFVKAQQILTCGLTYNRNFNPISGVSAYDTQTGGYISNKTNVDDTQTWSFNAAYDRSIGAFFSMQSNTQFVYTLNHGIKTLTSWEDPLEQFRRTSYFVHENLCLTFQNNGWEASAFTEVSHDGFSYSDPAFDNQNLWNYKLGMDSSYKIKHWTFNLQSTLVGYTGDLSDMMNRKRFSLLNASVTWKMLKNKGLLTFTAKDILNQMDEISYNITPTMRAESRKETFHRYCSLTFTYNFDAKAKK